MDRQRIDDEHLIARYLAGQLGAADAEAFEAYYTQNPEVVREIEATLRLREGLALLEERGELQALVREQRPRWQVPASLAAGVVMLVVGVWLWSSHGTVSPLAPTLADLARSGEQAAHVASTHVLASVRGADAAPEIALPTDGSAIELRLVPSAAASDTRFLITLQRLDAAGADTALGKTHLERGADDGVVTVYLDSRRLRPGRYAVDLIPERAGGTSTITRDHFEIELR